MKYIVVLCCVVAAVIAEEKYTDKYDNTNVDEILNNERLLIGYFNCLLDKAPCTAEGKELREHVEESLQTGCSKCTDIQKEKAEKVIRYIIEKKPEIWTELTTKFDPKGEYKAKYEKMAEEHGIKLP